jgi:hypothetical protein
MIARYLILVGCVSAPLCVLFAAAPASCDLVWDNGEPALWGAVHAWRADYEEWRETNECVDDFTLDRRTAVTRVEMVGMFTDKEPRADRIKALTVTVYAHDTDMRPGNRYASLTVSFGDPRLKIAVDQVRTETPGDKVKIGRSGKVIGQLVHISVEDPEPLFILPAGTWYISFVADNDEECFMWLASGSPRSEEDSPLWCRVHTEFLDGSGRPPVVTGWSESRRLPGRDNWNLSFKIYGEYAP